MPASSSPKKFLTRLLKILTIIFLASIFFSGLYFSGNYFKIKTIVVDNGQVDVLGLDEIKNYNMLFSSEKEISNLIISKNPSVRSVVLEKKYPSTLIVKLSFYQPVMVLPVDTGFFFLAQDGRIIKKTRTNDSGLPVINFYQKLNFQSYNPGDVVDFKEISEGLFFLKSLVDFDLKPVSLDINGINMLVFNLLDKKIIFDSEKDRSLQVYQLEQIVRQFKIEGKQYKEIDLRFDKPVVRF